MRLHLLIFAACLIAALSLGHVLGQFTAARAFVAQEQPPAREEGGLDNILAGGGGPEEAIAAVQTLTAELATLAAGNRQLKSEIGELKAERDRMRAEIRGLKTYTGYRESAAHAMTGGLR